MAMLNNHRVTLRNWELTVGTGSIELFERGTIQDLTEIPCRKLLLAGLVSPAFNERNEDR